MDQCIQSRPCIEILQLTLALLQLYLLFLYHNHIHQALHQVSMSLSSKKWTNFISYNGYLPSFSKFRANSWRPQALLHTMSFWNIIIQWISHDDLTEKIVSLVSKAKLVKWQKSKIALCTMHGSFFRSSCYQRFC